MNRLGGRALRRLTWGAVVASALLAGAAAAQEAPRPQAALAAARPMHIGFAVSDVDRSVRFYRDALGFKEKSRTVLDGHPALFGFKTPSMQADLVMMETGA